MDIIRPTVVFSLKQRVMVYSGLMIGHVAHINEVNLICASKTYMRRKLQDSYPVVAAMVTHNEPRDRVDRSFHKESDVNLFECTT